MHHIQVLLILHTLKQDAMIGGFVSSRHETNSSCRCRRRSPNLEGSCKDIEETDVKGRQRVTLQVMNFGEGQNKY